MKQHSVMPWGSIMLLSQHSSSINGHGSTGDAPESVHPRIARVNSVASGPSYTPDVRPKNRSGMAKSNTGGTGIAESSLDGDSHGRKVQSLSWRGGIRSGARLASISITRFRCVREYVVNIRHSWRG